MNKRVLIKKYFQDEIQEPQENVLFLEEYAKYGILLLFIGLFFLYIKNNINFNGIVILSVILIILGLTSFWIIIKPYIVNKELNIEDVEDGDIDIWFFEDINEVVVPKAIEVLGINKNNIKDENIIIVPHPIYWTNETSQYYNIKRKCGTDGTFVYSTWKIQILIATENFISYYSCIFDWLNLSVSEEITNEYFFDDIVSVKNDIIKLDYNFIDNNDISIGQTKVFTLSNMSGDKLTIISDIPSLNVPEGYSNNLERLVKAIRILLRNRRYGEDVELTEKYLESDIEFEVEMKIEGEDGGKKFFLHQLKELYSEYNKEIETNDTD
jgi:hypothetical protein